MATLLTRADLCRLFSISSSTLDRWIASGRIPPATHRFGYRSPRWSRESIDSVLKSAQGEIFR
ncbi:MAG: helix-turn-helix domain-containing protein [Cyanobium sp. M30B3]|nr:MAG: helix-turn-helix domain-containing protein [Cyanobium sp. M30B3]